MIKVSRLNREELLVNSDQIEMIEETPNTVLTLTSGRRLVVADSAAEIVDRIVAFRQRLYMCPPEITKK